MNSYHATATLAELSLAMSIAVVTKVVQSPQLLDSVAIETMSLRIKGEAGQFVSFCIKWLCKLQNTLARCVYWIPQLALVIQLAVLISMVYGPESNAHFLFWLALGIMMLMLVWVILNRSASLEEESLPMVEPIA